MALESETDSGAWCLRPPTRFGFAELSRITPASLAMYFQLLSGRSGSLIYSPDTALAE
jgi:hypothetical protein